MKDTPEEKKCICPKEFYTKACPVHEVLFTVTPEVSEWDATFAEILKKHDCWSQNIELDLLRHMEYLLKKCRDAALKEAAEALKNEQFIEPKGDRAKLINEGISRCQSTIRSLKS